MSTLCSATDTVSSSRWSILFKDLMLNFAICICYLHWSNWSNWSNFCFCDWFFLTLGVSAPTSAELTPCLPVWRAMQFGHVVGIRIMVIFQWLYFSLINRCHPYRWVVVVSWPKYLILAIDLWGSTAQQQVKCTIDPTLHSSGLLHIYHAASHGIQGLTYGYIYIYIKS